MYLSTFHPPLPTHSYQCSSTADPFHWWPPPDTPFINPVLIRSPSLILITYISVPSLYHVFTAPSPIPNLRVLHNYRLCEMLISGIWGALHIYATALKIMYKALSASHTYAWLLYFKHFKSVTHTLLLCLTQFTLTIFLTISL